MAGASRLTGTVKNYDWGGFSFLPSMLNTANDGKKTFAEYWLGVHPQADCHLDINGRSHLLREWIRSQGVSLLGKHVFDRFGNMPYLLKILDVRNMLSIQVHPSKAEAERDFASEHAAGIPIGAQERNYKDSNHKPELMVALGEFWLLHGFRPPQSMQDILKSVPEFSFLLPVFSQDNYAALYKKVMELPQPEVNEYLQPLLNRIVPLYEAGKLSKTDPSYWAARGHLTFSQPGKTDRGIFSVYLFNLVQLNRGEAIFQDAGVPHAYLEGQNVEIMASSDNVLRGGLTTKHIDVKELLKHVKCGPTYPDILTGIKKDNEIIYKTPAPDFQLSSFRISADESVTFSPVTAEILLLIEGKATVRDDDNIVTLEKGNLAAIVFPGNEVLLTASENSWVFRASVP